MWRERYSMCREEEAGYVYLSMGSVLERHCILTIRSLGACLKYGGSLRFSEDSQRGIWGDGDEKMEVVWLTDSGTGVSIRFVGRGMVYCVNTFVHLKLAIDDTIGIFLKVTCCGIDSVILYTSARRSGGTILRLDLMRDGGTGDEEYKDRSFVAEYDSAYEGSPPADDYYLKAGSAQFMKHLRKSSLCIEKLQRPGNNKGTIDNILSQLGSAFALKDLEPINYFLGIEIVPHAFNILLSQKKYNLGAIYKVLVKISTNSGIPLHYVTLSWPDIAFTVNKVIPILLLKLSYILTGLEIEMIDEAEYKALVDTVAELTWLQALLNEL
ncbi:integrase [Tanacetum coccineum]